MARKGGGSPSNLIEEKSRKMSYRKMRLLIGYPGGLLETARFHWSISARAPFQAISTDLCQNRTDEIALILPLIEKFLESKISIMKG